MSTMTELSIRKAIDAMGGLAEVAKALGIPHRQTVNYWHKKDYLPEWRRAEFAALAKKHRIKLTNLPK
jgi:DNA-binding XRE family transcriptional regulator